MPDVNVEERGQQKEHVLDVNVGQGVRQKEHVPDVNMEERSQTEGTCA